jgi:hypothetical protein
MLQISLFQRPGKLLRKVRRCKLPKTELHIRTDHLPVEEEAGESRRGSGNFQDRRHILPAGGVHRSCLLEHREALFARKHSGASPGRGDAPVYQRYQGHHQCPRGGGALVQHKSSAKDRQQIPQD